MSKLSVIENGLGLIITPLETITTIDELKVEISKSYFTCCNPFTGTHAYMVYDKNKKVYLFPINYDTQLMGGTDASLIYHNTLYDMVDINNEIHRQFILDYNGGDDFERAMFLTRVGKIRIISCPDINCEMEPNMEADIINGFVIINGGYYTLTDEWVYEFV